MDYFTFFINFFNFKWFNVWFHHLDLDRRKKNPQNNQFENILKNKKCQKLKFSWKKSDVRIFRKFFKFSRKKILKRQLYGRKRDNDQNVKKGRKIFSSDRKLFNTAICENRKRKKMKNLNKKTGKTWKKKMKSMNDEIKKVLDKANLEKSKTLERKKNHKKRESWKSFEKKQILN